MAAEANKFSIIPKYKIRAKRKKISEIIANHATSILKHFKTIGMIQKIRNRVPYKLKPGDFVRHLFSCKQLLQSWEMPKHAFILMPRPDIHGANIMLCIWSDQLGVVFYDLLKTSETNTRDRYITQLATLSTEI